MRIKPSDFGTDVSRQFIGSPIENFEMERVARNVVTVCMRRGDEWRPFTWEDYCDTVDHNPNWKEQSVLHDLVSKKLIDDNGEGNFSVNKRFIATFADYVQGDADAAKAAGGKVVA